EYRETIIEKEDGLYYQYGDELRKVKTDTVRLKFKSGNALVEKAFPTYHTHHGPVTYQEGDNWVATAMMWEPMKALEQSYIRTKQSGYEGFRKMMDIRTNSSNNTVYADAEGNIAYFHGNFIPVRDTIFDFTQSVDGSNPATDWKGLHTVDENILILNPGNGWIQNCNSTPYTAALEFSPKRGAYPKYMSRDQENFRGVHAIDLLKDKNDFTLESLITLAHDPYLPAFEVLLPKLFKAHQNVPNESLAQAISLLKDWDYKTSESSVAMTLAHYFGTKCWLWGVTGKIKRRPSLMEVFSSFEQYASDKEIVNLFSDVVLELEQKFGTWQMPWGEVNRYQRINGDV
ncbi:MAG: penicillin acylase family protein, partial [Bacteroidota bacterium]